LRLEVRTAPDAIPIAGSAGGQTLEEQDMRIALYRPAESDGDPYPFGDSRAGELIAGALRLAGHEVEPKELRCVSSNVEIRQVVADLTSSGPPPDVWISSQIDGRSGDRIGPAVSAALAIPYILLQPWFDRSVHAAGGKPAFPFQAIAAADATFVLSAAYAAKLAEHLPDHGDRVIGLPPFIDLDAVQPVINNRRTNRTLLAHKHQLATDMPWLIVTGPMATGADLDAFRLLTQAMTPLSTLKWCLIVAGSGCRRDEIPSLLGRIPVRHHRLLTVDSQADLLALLASGDLFIWPFTDESLPLPAIEAQALSLPIVAGRTAVMQEVVADGRTGMLVKPGNAASLGNAIGFLLRHPDFLRSHAEQGPKWVARHFDVRAIVSQLDATLHRVVRRASAADPAPPVRAVD
jgi:glycosyltransferase involved in cell wall biosynthesis